MRIPLSPGRPDATQPKILVALALSALSGIVIWIFARGYGYWVLGQTLGVRSLCRWDCYWYGSILLSGYDAVPSRNPAGDGANWAFYPLFPALASLWHRLAGFGFEYSLIITGTLALPVCIYFFIEFVDGEGIALNPWVSGSLVAFGPYAFYAHTGYSESLYFALSTGALLALRRDRWLAVGALGAACSATRLVGVFLVRKRPAQIPSNLP